MEYHRLANTLAQAITQDENPRDDGQVMAKLMAHVDQRAAASRRSCVRLNGPLTRAACDHHIERIADRPAQKAGSCVPGEGLGGSVPECDLTFQSGHGDSVRENVQRGFKQFHSISHRSLSLWFIGEREGNLIWLLRKEGHPLERGCRELDELVQRVCGELNGVFGNGAETGRDIG
jgi:hypothetical protein